MNPLLIQCLLTTACPPGEYGLDPPNCTTCWPCEPGFQCANSAKRECGDGTWSARGASKCSRCDEMCEAGLLRVRKCDATGDLVCAACPLGFGCDGGDAASVCGSGTYSVSGVCMKCGVNQSSDAGASECMCLGREWGSTKCLGCPVNTIAVGTQCRPSPRGYGLISGELQLCPRDTYSSSSGQCTQCRSNAWSEPGAASEEECVCVDGYVRGGRECVPCKAGTVFENGKCVLCAPGEYCLGKTHHEPCPTDMYSHHGAGMCTPCRMNSGCLKHCTSEANCTCDNGYINSMGECRRCPSGTMERGDECIPCLPGYECKGGADVWQCPLTKWSPGNVSECLPFEKCLEITSSRCNSTHNSVCDQTLVPLGVLNVFQQYTMLSESGKTEDTIDGEIFATFALLYVASIPKAQLLRVCDKDQCVQCFQGICPDASRTMRKLYGPGYEIAFEVRTFASRMDDNIESLNRPAYLSELAKTTMQKLTENEFIFFSRIEHSMICPFGLYWDKITCRERYSSDTGQQQRSWVGLGLSILILISLTILGWNGRRWMEAVLDRCRLRKKKVMELDSIKEYEEEDEEDEDQRIIDSFPGKWLDGNWSNGNNNNNNK